jgi:uncharacterized protein (DUF58 family)
LKIANRKHDIVALKIYDKRETEMPSIGLVKLKDAETGQYNWVDTSSKAVREAYRKWWTETDQKTKNTFRKCGVDNVSVSTDDDYVKALISLFKKRA